MALSFFSRKSTRSPGPVGQFAAVNPLWGNVFQFGSAKAESEAAIYKVLKAIPMFEELGRRELAAVIRILYERSYEAGELIFHQHDPGLGMYIIVQGTVTIVREPDHQVLAELHDGDFFGELALLDELPRSATAIAKTSSRVVGFFQPELFGLLERHPRLGIKILIRLSRIMGRRLRVMDERSQRASEQSTA
jgi:CRP/FNR family transcriptional regulator, cyclic AMP receptor protein